MRWFLWWERAFFALIFTTGSPVHNGERVGATRPVRKIVVLCLNSLQKCACLCFEGLPLQIFTPKTVEPKNVWAQQRCAHTNWGMRLFAVQRIHHCDSGDFNDVVDFVTGLDDVDGRARAEQDRANCFGVAQAREQFVGDVGAF